MCYIIEYESNINKGVNKMTKREVITKFCQLSHYVNDHHFGFSFPSDCFCERDHEINSSVLDYQFSSEVIEYIEKAVKYYIKNGK